MERTVVCEHCGATVKVTGRYSKCEYCDGTVEVKDYKEENISHGWQEAGYSREEAHKPDVYAKPPMAKEGMTFDIDYVKKNKMIKLIILCGILFFLLSGTNSDGVSFVFLVALFFLWREVKKNKRNRPMVFDNHLLPWYLKTGWIIVIGMFTGGIYWFAGPIMRIFWKENRGY